MFQGGGNIPLTIPVVARLVARGHQVRVMAGPGIRRSRLRVSAAFSERIRAAGADRIPFREPDIHPLDEAPAPRGLLGGWAPKSLHGIQLETQTALWTPVWAENVTAELPRERPDMVVSDFFLLGALAAAEAARIPVVALVHNAFPPRPASGHPPKGLGLLPVSGPIDFLRIGLIQTAVDRLYVRNALPPVNRARSWLGLPPLRLPFEQYDAAARVLILSSRAFDLPARRLPSNIRYVGAPLDDEGTSPWDLPWPADDPRSLVIVSLSTLDQGQARVLPQILKAVSTLPIRVLVTLGPLDPAQFSAPSNVRLERFVPHAAVLPRAAALVTQAGLGGVTKALAHSVPLVCIPLVGDQPDNAARVVAHGVGISLARDASPDLIRAAVRRVLDEPRFRERARQMADALAKEDGAQAAAREIEAVALS